MVLGEINFTESEYALATRLSKNPSEPDFEKNFWATTIEKKIADPNYSLFQDFPELEKKEAPKPKTKKGFVGEEICEAIIEGLKGRTA